MKDYYVNRIVSVQMDILDKVLIIAKPFEIISLFCTRLKPIYDRYHYSYCQFVIVIGLCF